MRQALVCIGSVTLVGLISLTLGDTGGLRTLAINRDLSKTCSEVDDFVWADFHDGAGPHCVQLEARPLIVRSGGSAESPDFEDFSERIKTLITFGLEEMIPSPYSGIGKVVSLVLDLFWPSSKPSIWDQVKDQVSNLVDQKILQSRLETLTATLNGIQASLRSFENAKNAGRGQILNALMVSLNVLKEQIKGTGNQQNDRKMMIPLATAVASMHLTVLRERVVHNIIYSSNGEDNTIGYTADLADAIDWWQSYFFETYRDWYSWRYAQITTGWGSSLYWVLPPLWDCWGTATDNLTGRRFHKIVNMRNCAECYKNYALNRKALMVGEAQMAMAKTMTATFYLRNFLPGKERELANLTAQVKNEFSEIQAGPYNINTDLEFELIADSYAKDESGSVRGFKVGSYQNTIYRLQAIYDTHDGASIGTVPYGTSVILDEVFLEAPPGNATSSISLFQKSGALRAMQLGFSNGEHSIRAGDQSSAVSFLTDAGSAYELTQVAYDKTFTRGKDIFELRGMLFKLKFKGYDRPTRA